MTLCSSYGPDEADAHALRPLQVPKYKPHAGSLPVISAIDHYNARLATRRLADGATRAMEYGPGAGVEVVPPCFPAPGLMCVSGSGARKMNQRRSMCRL